MAVEHTAETTAGPDEIWQLWANVSGWPEWNHDIEGIELIGAFAPGGTILMTPIGDETVELRIAEAVEPEFFVDEAHLGELVVRTLHLVERIPAERSRVTYRMEITGSGADTLGAWVGPKIGADFPETLAELVACAERLRHERSPH